MIKNKYICIIYCLSSGQNEENLGSDEQEIISICYVIIDVIKKKSIDIIHFLIKPSFKSDQFISDECKALTNIKDESCFDNANSLDNVIVEFDKYLIHKKYHPSQLDNEFIFLTDGPLHLRQALIPECNKKNINLPNYYYRYFNLISDFYDYAKLLGISDEFKNLKDITKIMSIDVINQNDYIIKQSILIEKVVIKMLSNGYTFNKIQIISRELELGLCSFDETVDDNTIVRVRGLPWQCTDQDVCHFFAGLNIALGGVALCLSLQGRRNGEALVRFVNEENRNLALRRHKHHIAQRYIEVYRANGKDFLNVAGGSNSEAKAFLSRNGKVIIRMRGLPFDSTAKDVVSFFERGENSCQIVDGEIGVLFVHYPDGRATGDAFVMVKDDEIANKVLLKHKETMGSRYIELFRSTSAEVQQVLKRSQDPKYYQNASKDLSTIPLSVLPPEMSGGKKDCIRLRNLPLECGVEQILEFLGVHSQHIVHQGVHMILNAQGNPSGEAFIQFDSEQSSFNVSTHKNGRFMFFNSKKYFIEVIQCSGEEMNLVLLGLLPSSLINSNISYQNIKPSSSKLVNGTNLNLNPYLNLSNINGASCQNNLQFQSTNQSKSNINMYFPNQIRPLGHPSIPPQQATSTSIAQLNPVQTQSVYLTSQQMIQNTLISNQLTANNNYVQPIIYWYPTPPVSPTQKLYYAAPQITIPAPTVLIIKGAPVGITVADVLAFFHGYEILPEYIQIQNNTEFFQNGLNTVDVFVTFFNRNEAERAYIEKNHFKIGNNTIELYIAI